MSSLKRIFWRVFSTCIFAGASSVELYTAYSIVLLVNLENQQSNPKGVKVIFLKDFAYVLKLVIRTCETFRV